MRSVIGHSDDVDSLDAIRQVIRTCREQLNGERPQGALLFMSVDYEHQVVLDAIAEEWPGLPLVGGSSDGEVSSQHGYSMDSVLLTLLCGEELTIEAGLGTNLSRDLEASVAAATGGLASPPSLALTTFAPSTNASEVLRAMQRHLPATSCPVLGGLTGDHRDFEHMTEFFGSQVLRDSLPVLFVSGDLRVSWGIGSGWMPIGESHVVTESAGHLVQRIGDEPALQLYGHYYGEVPTGFLGEYPLAVYENGPDGPWTLRAILGVDSDSGEMRFAGDVPTGAHVRMTEVVPDGILSGTMESIRHALDRFPEDTTPELALLFTCAARKWVLGSQAEEEIRTVRANLRESGSEQLSLAGLYVYGEIAPDEPGSGSLLHNETCVTVLLGSDGRRRPSA